MISRQVNCLIIMVTSIWFLGLSSAANSRVASIQFCPLDPKSSIESELEDLFSEVNRMDAYVRDFEKPKQSSESLFDVAYKAICSELKQNASRLRLLEKAGPKSKPAYDKIKPLIDQILIHLQNFIIDPSAAVKNAPELSKTITAIRAKAKPRKKFSTRVEILKKKIETQVADSFSKNAYTVNAELRKNAGGQ
ncbi:uncharacterized protein MELLADRAFT_124314 [Melampsora larici-populina 98AG31]|uniref:Secreted protein n=1 Tax=Melampsora larici-populina (strain 98AG31 / pathotype 3-4-7) TaxID=747676 RepID=F4RTC3_MELLP|nr:uncharacterized protein MELLADRAFT_124314 [Melampsora larici-populina 98AG31]EGG04369.1 secreted protein [Melampsora larici-populina 98AG31]